MSGLNTAGPAARGDELGKERFYLQEQFCGQGVWEKPRIQRPVQCLNCV